MPSFGNRTLFLFCTVGCLSIRWPERKARLKRETAARFLQPSLVWKVTMATLTEQEGRRHGCQRHQETDFSDPGPVYTGGPSTEEGARADPHRDPGKSAMSSNEGWTEEGKGVRGRHASCLRDIVWRHQAGSRHTSLGFEWEARAGTWIWELRKY